MLAHEDIPVFRVLRVLGVQAPGIGAAGLVCLGEHGAGAVAVGKALGRDAVVILGDELAHGAERFFRGELIAAVGDKVGAVELGRDRQTDRRLRGEGFGLDRRVARLRAALCDQHNDQDQQHQRSGRDEQRQISAQPDALLSSSVHSRTSMMCSGLRSVDRLHAVYSLL